MTENRQTFQGFFKKKNVDQAKRGKSETDKEPQRASLADFRQFPPKTTVVDALGTPKTKAEANRTAGRENRKARAEQNRAEGRTAGQEAGSAPSRNERTATPRKANREPRKSRQAKPEPKSQPGRERTHQNAKPNSSKAKDELAQTNDQPETKRQGQQRNGRHGCKRADRKAGIGRRNDRGQQRRREEAMPPSGRGNGQRLRRQGGGAALGHPHPTTPRPATLRALSGRRKPSRRLSERHPR